MAQIKAAQNVGAIPPSSDGYGAMSAALALRSAVSDMKTNVPNRNDAEAGLGAGHGSGRRHFPLGAEGRGVVPVWKHTRIIRNRERAVYGAEQGVAARITVQSGSSVHRGANTTLPRQMCEDRQRGKSRGRRARAGWNFCFATLHVTWCSLVHAALFRE